MKITRSFLRVGFAVILVPVAVTLLAKSIIPTPTAADVAGVWSGYGGGEMSDMFVRLELETNGTGFLCVSHLPSVNDLYRVESWTVTNFSVELRTQDIPPLLDRPPDLRKFKYSRSALEGELETWGIKQTIKLYSQREWQSRSTAAEEKITQYRKNKRL